MSVLPSLHNFDYCRYTIIDWADFSSIILLNFFFKALLILLPFHINYRKNNLVYIFGRTDAEAETPILWPPDAKGDSLEKSLMLGKLEGRRRRG